MARILLTGGAGYIASHTAVALVERGHKVVLLDNFANSERDVPDRLRRLTGELFPVIEADIRDVKAVTDAMKAFPVDAIIHFAALKAVGESEADPLLYYDMNIVGTIRLFEAMQNAGVHRLVFSSSATVYGQPDSSPILEDAPTRVNNIYGRTKLVMEDLIRDLARTGKLKGAANLRYFNPVGAHSSAMIGETPSGVPNNLMPYITQVATGERPYLNVFGNDYDTPDGTGVRDYIHVMDLACAHTLAVEHIIANDVSVTTNLGTGIGLSVLDLVHAFERATGRKIPLNFAPRRAGDVASYYANPAMAEKLFGWKAALNVDDMCRDAWRWQAKRAGINDV
ncbi:MAG: UDP-glucose 4-epimerase GalE [Acidocella sp. 20-57-95]|nr:MAG: UDP-glucose 4-epimerase GalE [Acidocella sp. 20-57-95]OYV59508.1 MAG: UDP-glucose 4-epimerase GalE [Acidocella sp. 21-58-7]HQT64602.1 UDP-glucose 4-epimerase GalE [Acidocella sp.]HQU04391.1 UDP-glucose 4-epimerase GalE [Acidocella sp.]